MPKTVISKTKIQLVYILQDFWVGRTPNTGQVFNNVNAKKLKKGGKARKLGQN